MSESSVKSFCVQTLIAWSPRADSVPESTYREVGFLGCSDPPDQASCCCCRASRWRIQQERRLSTESGRASPWPDH